MDSNTCERCQGRHWVPIEGTITAAIEAHHGKGRVPCPECSVPHTQSQLGRLVYADRTIIQTLDHHSDLAELLHWDDRPGEQEANAKRLAFAWNAVEGIATDALTPGSVKALVDAMYTAKWAIRQALPAILGTGGLSSLQQAHDTLQRALIPFKGAQEVKPDVV